MTQRFATIENSEPAQREAFAPWPCYPQDEIDAATRVLRSGKVNYWTGQETRLFESEYAAYLGVKHAIALANGTLALEAALLALDIGTGDDVIVPCRTFIASASCVVARGARPVVCDIDAQSQNLDVDTIKAVITPQTKAIIVVHLAGWPCDMDSINAFAKERGLYVIEDCAQAHGALYKGRPVGTLGDIAAFSFCQDKIISTAGEGGLVATNNTEWWNKIWSYKDHGKSFAATQNKSAAAGYRWLHESFGSNWRMTEVQAAIGRLQLQKLESWIMARNSNAAFLFEHLKNIPALDVPRPSRDIRHAYYKFYAFVKPDRLKDGWTRNKIIEALNAEGIPCQTGSCGEIYLEKAFDHAGLKPAERFATAPVLAESSLMFLVHPTLTSAEIERVGNAVRKVFAVCS